MAFCTECGSRLSAADKFCSSCGSRVSESAKSSEISELRDTKPVLPTEPSDGAVRRAATTARVAPIYGPGFKSNIHCANCGSKPGNGKLCTVCQADL